MSFVEGILFALFIGFIVSFVSWLILCFIHWIAHIKMTKDDSNIYGWGNYSKFKREFAKYNWYGHKDIEDYLLDNKNKCSLNTGVYLFENKGMLINNPISFILCEYHVAKYYKELYPGKKKKVIKW